MNVWPFNSKIDKEELERIEKKLRESQKTVRDSAERLTARLHTEIVVPKKQKEV